jgi:transposase
MTPSPTTTVLLVTGVALVAWATVRLARRRVRSASVTVPYYARASTIRPERRLDRLPAARVRRDVHCPAGRAIAQRHTARRRDDR